MEVYVLIVRLAAGFDPIAYEVRDCDASAADWAKRAGEWAKRNNVPPLDGPIWSCQPKHKLDPRILLVSY